MATALQDCRDFRLGSLQVRPAARTIGSASGSFVTEPLVMQLLVQLSRRAGHLVTRREIFEHCWGEAAVGDDSLNRVIRALRAALRATCDDEVRIETIQGAGYTLRLQQPTQQAHIDEDRERISHIALDSVRLGVPEPDNLTLEMLRRDLLIDRQNAGAWGMLAILSRYAAEYAEPRDIAEHVAECESSARRALELNPRQPHARTALATISPVFGRWREARPALQVIAEEFPHDLIANQELVIVDMATGRVRDALARSSKLVTADPLAACVIYKAIYQSWAGGDHLGMDRFAERAIHLWPKHPAIWAARLWTLAFTDRARAALEMLEDDRFRPEIPPPSLQSMKLVIVAAISGNNGDIGRAVDSVCSGAGRGPARAIVALFALGLLHRVQDAFHVAERYYLRSGDDPVPVGRTSGEPSINDQHRRVTQILFTPACEEMRADPRFMTLAERVGLAAYWEETGLVPDFLT